MLLVDLPQVLLRRWYLVVAGLCVTIGLCAMAVAAVPLRYTAQGELLLLPSVATTGEGGNPYAGLGGLGPAGDVLSKAMSDDATRRALEASGLEGAYTVGLDGTSSAPLILVTVEAQSPSRALAYLGALLDRAPKTLAELQRDLGIEERAFISSTVVTQTRRAEVLRTPQLRAVIVAGTGGLAATLLGTALLDSLLSARTQRRHETQAATRLVRDDASAGAGPHSHARTSGKSA